VKEGRVADTDPVRYPSTRYCWWWKTSRSAPGTDRAIKSDLYAKAGIAASWLVTLRELLADTARMRQPSPAHRVPRRVG